MSLILSLSVLEVRLGDRVELKNPTGLPLTQHGQDCDPTGVLCVQIFRVKETETTVDVLWQDGSRETLKATDLIPYLNPDENDCWSVLKLLALLVFLLNLCKAWGPDCSQGRRYGKARSSPIR